MFHPGQYAGVAPEITSTAFSFLCHLDVKHICQERYLCNGFMP